MSGTFYVLCGTPGSGKTTYSSIQLEPKGCVRLSNDEWMVELAGQCPAIDEFRTTFQKVSKIQRDLATRLLSIGIDVVWDYGVWTRSDRKEAIGIAPMGSRKVLIVFDCNLAEAARRIVGRQSARGYRGMIIPDSAIEILFSRFEKPMDAEGYDELIRITG